MKEITVSRVEGQPIIHVVIKGHLTVEGAMEVFQKSAELRKDMPKYIYRITDVSEVETSFSDMMGILKQAAVKGGSSSMDPTITVVFVGTTHWLKLFTDAMRQGAFGGKEMPVFTSFADAFAYIQSDMASKEESA